MTHDDEINALVGSTLRGMASPTPPDASEAQRIWLRAYALRAARRERSAMAPLDVGVSLVVAVGALGVAAIGAANWPMLAEINPALAAAALAGLSAVAIAAGASALKAYLA